VASAAVGIWVRTMMPMTVAVAGSRATIRAYVARAAVAWRAVTDEADMRETEWNAAETADGRMLSRIDAQGQNWLASPYVDDIDHGWR
jgi:hypothetical protein